MNISLSRFFFLRKFFRQKSPKVVLVICPFSENFAGCILSISPEHFQGIFLYLAAGAFGNLLSVIVFVGDLILSGF